MISKAIIKDIQNLGLKKVRDEQGLFVAEGVKWMEELIRFAPERIRCIYALAPWIEANRSALKSFAVVEVDEILLARLSQLQTPNQAIAVVHQFLHEPQPVESGLTLILDTIQDPGNLGTLIRTADWFGVTQIICSPDSVDAYNPKVVQASMGSLVRVPVSQTSLFEWLHAQSEVPKWAAVLAGKNYSEIKPNGVGVLMMGNESKGLSKELLDMATDHVTIPRRGGAESLNVAVATGILLSSLCR